MVGEVASQARDRIVLVEASWLHQSAQDASLLGQLSARSLEVFSGNDGSNDERQEDHKQAEVQDAVSNHTAFPQLGLLE